MPSLFEQPDHKYIFWFPDPSGVLQSGEAMKATTRAVNRVGATPDGIAYLELISSHTLGFPSIPCFGSCQVCFETATLQIHVLVS
jgi:hypothetical protein